jgi:hypothetical protein
MKSRSAEAGGVAKCVVELAQCAGDHRAQRRARRVDAAVAFEQAKDPLHVSFGALLAADREHATQLCGQAGNRLLTLASVEDFLRVHHSTYNLLEFVRSALRRRIAPALGIRSCSSCARLRYGGLRR